MTEQSLGIILEDYEIGLKELNEIKNKILYRMNDLNSLFPDTEVNINIKQDYLEITMKNSVDPYSVCDLGTLYKYFNDAHINTKNIVIGINEDFELELYYEFNRVF